MKTYIIRATRETLYEFCVTADSERGAREEMAIIEKSGMSEDFAYELSPLKITEIDEEEKQ